jgi:hypothetical protein
MTAVNYAPTHGYFDLTIKPKTLTVREHEKIQEFQMIIIAEAKRYQDPKIRRNNIYSYQTLLHHMAELQYIILKHWSLDDL